MKHPAIKLRHAVSLLTSLLVLAGCGQSSDTTVAERQPSGLPVPVAARSLDKSQLNPQLIRAVSAGDASRVQELLAEGADAKTETGWGKPALHLACERGKLAIVQALLDKGADVNKQIDRKFSDDGMGYDGAAAGSPLTYAVSKGHANVARLLLDKGAEINVWTPQDRTPLMCVAGEMLPTSNHVACARLLVEKGADVNARTKDGFTALTMASGGYYVPGQKEFADAKKEIARLLTEAGARR